MDFGGCEKENSKSFVAPDDVRDRETLLTEIRRWIRPGSIIMSDCWKAYECISDMGLGYTHKTINHSKEFKSKDGTCTNTIEGMWRHLKISLSPSVKSGN